MFSLSAFGAEIVVIATCLVALGILFHPRVHKSSSWRAAVSPLASIIGSGFLVVAPLLFANVGQWAIAAMAGLVGISYMLGWVIRYNIRFLEPAVVHARDGRIFDWCEIAGKGTLAFAYIISIAFYIKLLSAFLARGIGLEGNELFINGTSTALLLLIAVAGLFRGLHMMEDLEEYAVNAKLAIIAALLAGLAWYNLSLWMNGKWGWSDGTPEWDFHTLRQLAGMLLIVQGFEISRYLGAEYTAWKRVGTMRLAQVIAGMIYLAFVGLVMVTLRPGMDTSETAIISISGEVSFLLPWLLILGAVLSQFGAAVADTIGSGGLGEEATQGRIKSTHLYPAVGVICIALIWAINIFDIISYASRAFALYYGVQCLIAIIVAWHNPLGRQNLRPARITGFALLGAAMLFVLIFGLPGTH